MESAEPKRMQIEKLLADVDEDTRRVVIDLFKLEQEMLYMSQPYGIVEDVVARIKEIVK
jgi:hypothetical protein